MTSLSNVLAMNTIQNSCDILGERKRRISRIESREETSLCYDVVATQLSPNGSWQDAFKSVSTVSGPPLPLQPLQVASFLSIWVSVSSIHWSSRGSIDLQIDIFGLSTTDDPSAVNDHDWNSSDTASAGLFNHVIHFLQVFL